MPKSHRPRFAPVCLAPAARIAAFARVAVVIGLAASLALVFVPLGCRTASKAIPAVTGRSEPPRSPLTGRPINPRTLKQRPVGVMIENFWSVRPQSGLNRADVVVEAKAEGGITRFLAIYHSRGADVLGPVRSARPYYIQMALGFNAIYAHVGGSTFAMKNLKEWNVADIDQMIHPKPFWRVNWVAAPHNVFSATSRLRTEAKRLGYDTVGPSTGFEFKEDEAPGVRPRRQAIVIDFSSRSYKVIYRYSPKLNSYLRYHGAFSHRDKITGNQIAPKNVVVLIMTTRQVGNTELINIKVVGSGKALVFQDGKVTAARWRKNSMNDQVVLTTPEGDPIALNRGQTWFEIIESMKKVAYTKASKVKKVKKSSKAGSSEKG